MQLSIFLQLLAQILLMSRNQSSFLFSLAMNRPIFRLPLILEPIDGSLIPAILVPEGLITGTQICLLCLKLVQLGFQSVNFGKL